MQINSVNGISSSQIPASKPTIAEQESGIGVEYSARAAGKTYSANIEQLENEYEAQVPNLPGAGVVGSTVEKVEDRLNNLISFFA
jgi:hypothetical protein